MQKGDLEIGNYIEYKYRDYKMQIDRKDRGYIVAFCKSGGNDIVWTGKEKNVHQKGLQCVFVADILRKVPPPQA